MEKYTLALNGDPGVSDVYDVAHTEQAMIELVEEMGFDDLLDFLVATSVNPYRLIGVPFMLINNRIFTGDEAILKSQGYEPCLIEE